MSPRPRTVSDMEVFAAAQRAMARLGPLDLTLAAIAEEAGLTAGALVQRFGSKRRLLLALSSHSTAGTKAAFARMRQAHRSPLGALRAYASHMAALATTPAALARNLAYLQIDLADPDFRTHLVAQARATRAALEDLVAEAVRSRELVPTTNPRRLARTVETTVTGSLMAWACYQDGSAGEWVRADLEAVLAPYRAERRRPPGHTSK